MSEFPQNTNPTSASSVSAVAAPILACLQEALRGLRYGQVTLIVQDGLVVQVDRLERKRLPKGTP